ncbi:MAG: Eco29kI family restriction endonuclease, partial [Azonexus sp.]|nr:Eco29kI family restriction endonuclease [Azonexus sp.]
MTDSKVVPFNPLDKRHLGENVGQAMLRQLVIPLGSLDTFDGAGIYAIYYTGTFPGYEAIAERNRDRRFNAPIYVGKAVPKGARKGGHVTDRPIGATHDRLNGATCRLRKTGLERGAVSGVLWGLGNCRFCGLR